jgi:hypothetical protein
MTTLPEILEKRITCFKLPEVHPTGIIALCLLCGNPGACILGLIETLEIAKEHPGAILDIDFIGKYVYPMGFYQDEEWHQLLDERRAKQTESYNHIIM